MCCLKKTLKAHGPKSSAPPQKLKPLSGVGKCSEDFKCGLFGRDCSLPLDRTGTAPSGMTSVFFLHLLTPQWTLLCFFALLPAFPAPPLYCLGVGFLLRPFSVGLSGSIWSHQVHPAFSHAPKHRAPPGNPACAALG